MSAKIGVIGAGAWGTALAQTYAAAGNDVTLWACEPEVASAVNAQHENTVFLPGIKLDIKIRATSDMAAAAKADIVLLVTPAQHARGALASLKELVKKSCPVVICAKGLETGTGKMLSEVAAEEAPEMKIAILTGPTFAAEIARGLPSGVTVASKSKKSAEKIRDMLASKTLRPYVSADMTGVQIGGAVKNVIAIASGIVAGRGLGDSARAALITRGLAEMTRLGAAMGAKKETLMGMCGVGDLVLTASSMQSRNYSLGFELGKGRAVDDVLGARKSVTEGVHTAKAVMVMAKNNGVDMPISAAVNACLNEGISIDRAIAALMDRPLRSETA
ncbi:MAG: NAD(P)-dependent glycerol-3-phosphate dehydrogenase [Proteobacteria bacterium]|nr:NAD(P)-dependent glycerol-3-phosphate dehydrogenase [Pseudomonadota bacterium]